MRLKYGGNTLEDSECLITYNGAQRVYNARGKAWRMQRVWHIEGEIVASGQAAIESRRQIIEGYFQAEGGTAQLLNDSGQPTYVLTGEFGVKVLELAWLQEEARAHFATALPFRIRLFAESIISDGDTLLAYEETVTRIGNGGPREVWVEIQNGPPVRQITAAQTSITIIQRGTAVGEYGWPLLNEPLFPENLQNPEEATERIAPQRDGLLNVAYTVRWNYIFKFGPGQALGFPIIR